MVSDIYLTSKDLRSNTSLIVW